MRFVQDTPSIIDRFGLIDLPFVVDYCMILNSSVVVQIMFLCHVPLLRNGCSSACGPKGGISGECAP